MPGVRGEEHDEGDDEGAGPAAPMRGLLARHLERLQAEVDAAVEPQMAALDHGIAALQALASEAHQDVNEELAEAQQRPKGVHAAVQSFQERWLASFLPGADLPAAVPGDSAAL